MPGETAPKEFEFRPLSVFPANQPATEFRFEVSRDGGWHEYRMLRAEEWATHSLRHEDRKSGIRSVITKTETRGPYTRPFTVYFIHTKTAFSVKGVCKRFSDFKELDVKLKKLFKGFNSPFPPDKVFNALQPEFVNERRKQLQRYLDDALEFPDIANCPDLHVFLNIPEYNDLVSEEQKEEFQRAQIRNSNPDADKPETYLRAIDLVRPQGVCGCSAGFFPVLPVYRMPMRSNQTCVERIPLRASNPCVSVCASSCACTVIASDRPHGAASVEVSPHHTRTHTFTHIHTLSLARSFPPLLSLTNQPSPTTGKGFERPHCRSTGIQRAGPHIFRNGAGSAGHRVHGERAGTMPCRGRRARHLPHTQ